MDLFLTPLSKTFQKEAAKASLPEDPNTWPVEITQELYKQVPYVSELHPRVAMQKVDGEKSYGVGDAEISTRTALKDPSPEQRSALGSRSVKIPLLIESKKLYPLDLLVIPSGKIVPLTKERLRQELFQPQIFDMTGPRDQTSDSLVELLYPPQRSFSTMGSMGMDGGNVVKQGSEMEQVRKEKMWKDHEGKPVQDDFHARILKVLSDSKKEVNNLQKSAEFKPSPQAINATKIVNQIPKRVVVKVGSLLKAVLPSVKLASKEVFLSQFKDRQLFHAYEQNKLAHDSLALFTREEEAKEASDVPVDEGSILQVTKNVGQGYTVKLASPKSWAPKTFQMDRGQVVQTFGVKLAESADLSGSVTTFPGDAKEEGPEASSAAVVTSFGLYKVKDSEGKDVVGYVIPNLYDLSGRSLPMTLFTNGSVAALQENVVGELLALGSNMPAEEPKGHGVFYWATSSGGVEATVPVDVRSTTNVEGEVKYLVEDAFGGRYGVTCQPHVTKPMSVNDMCLLPTRTRWMPIEHSKTVKVSSMTEVGTEKKASKYLQALQGVTIKSAGNSFSLDGECVAKLAYEEKTFLNVDDTMFVLAGLGLDSDYATEKLADARYCGSSIAKIGAPLVHEGHYKEALLDKLASRKLPDVSHMRIDLVKEAAVVPDAVAIDTMLSLGFLTPQNVEVFAKHLPIMDEAQKRLCELLLASRMGLRAIPEEALERAIKGVERAITGLKELAFQSTDEA